MCVAQRYYGKSWQIGLKPLMVCTICADGAKLVVSVLGNVTGAASETRQSAESCLLYTSPSPRD